MTAIINGSSPSITFSDNTTQATSAIVSGKVPSAYMPTGTILQVVTAQIATRYDINTRSFAGFGPTLSITPRSTSSRIYLLTSMSIQFPSYSYMTFFRDGTNVSGAAQGIITYGATSIWFNTTMMYVDSPATTSAITYQIAMYSNSGTISLNDYSAGNNNQLIAMEIAG